MASSLVFDMDGTLINSSSGILSALSLSLSEFAYHSIDVNSTHVGPPLASVFRKLVPCADDFRINQLCLSFQYHYDSSGYLYSRPYAGIAQVLEALTHLRYRLFIVTNKRAAPTQKIIDLLEWNHYFEYVYSLDMCDSRDATKADSLSSLLLRFNLDPLLTPYLGDRFDDYLAATSVSMPFLLAEWGYASRCEFYGISDFTCLASPPSLMSSSFLRHCS